MKERKVADSESGNYLSALGNENIIRNYVAYFEKMMVSEIGEVRDIEYEMSSASFPNFAAWIRFYTELICNSLYWRLFRYDGDWENIMKLSFGEVRRMIIERIKKENESLADKRNENELIAMEKDINLILNLRHSFQHGGLPNLMRNLWYGSSEEEFHRILKPKDYKETKEILLKVDQFIKILPQPTIRI